MSFVQGKCPSCSAVIQVPADRERAICMYCGTSLTTQAAISLLGGPNPKDTLALALQLLRARDFRQADEKLNRVLEWNPKNSDAWAAKAYISINPDLNDIKTAQDLLTRIFSACKQATVYLQNALEISSFDEEISKLLSQLFVDDVVKRGGDHPDGQLASSSGITLLTCKISYEQADLKETLYKCRSAWKLVAVFCLLAAQEINPALDLKFDIYKLRRYCEGPYANSVDEQAIELADRLMKEFDQEHPGWREQAKVKAEAEEKANLERSEREFAEYQQKQATERAAQRASQPKKASFWDIFG
jgi:hypothetical protein